MQPFHISVTDGVAGEAQSPALPVLMKNMVSDSLRWRSGVEIFCSIYLRAQDLDLFAQACHGEVVGGLFCFGYQCQRLLAITWLSAGDEHSRIVVLGVRHEGERAHAGIPGNGVEKMPLS